MSGEKGVVGWKKEEAEKSGGCRGFCLFCPVNVLLDVERPSQLVEHLPGFF